MPEKGQDYMSYDEGIMKVEKTLPADFDGVFRFTNWTDEDFVGVWGKKGYLFPARKTSPMVIPDHSPIEIQHIRKKFAKDLGELAYYNDKKGGYKNMMKQERNTDGSPKLNSIHQAGSYTIDDLAPYIQRCLEPLPISKAIVSDVESADIQDILTHDDEGNLNTVPVDKKTSLKEKAFKNEKIVVEV